ncbi:hypothetical protein N7507_008147 [Penicillium longicatenatum]|nr:hypothetical protein N7507_008147 [Penicillium longicatenatum]
MLKAAVKRSACDQCRAKRVRCLRVENSTAPCARCDHIGARCVTGAPGHPGRPPKQRTVDGRPAAANPAGVSSPGGAGRRHRTSTSLREVNHVDIYAPAMAGEPVPATSAPTKAPRYRADMRTSWDRWLDGVAASDLAGSKPVQSNPPGNLLAHDGPQPDFWGASDDSAALFGSPSIEQSPAAPGKDILALVDVDQLSGPSQLRGLLSADDEIDAMLDMGQDSSSSVLDMDLGPLLDPPASSLMRFREDMDQRIAAVDAYYSDPVKVVQGCKEEGAGAEQAENPAALLLTCSTKFIDIIQSLTPAAGQTHTQSEDALSTEVVLLALSSYLALMRLFDSLFHTIYEFICDLPPASFKSVKVKSVLRIGGISTLQDMPLKTYATGILDAIQGQVRTLERCMGIPTEHCLSGEAAASATPGIFSRSDRTRLFWAVIEQEDVKSRRGGKSYVESIRASIKDSMRFLDD